MSFLTSVRIQPAPCTVSTHVGPMCARPTTELSACACHQMVSLDSLSVYWNSRTQLYGRLSKEERERRFISEIATSDATPPGTKYSETTE